VVTNGELYPAEAADPYCLADGEAERLVAGHPWRRFVVVGDSIAEGLGDPSPGYPNVPWCDRIAAELGRGVPDFAYLNLGVHETQSVDVVATQLPAALDFKPDLALVACGGYDILRLFYDNKAVQEALRTLVSGFRQAGADVLTVGLFDGSQAPAMPKEFKVVLRRRLQGLSTMTKAVANEYGALHVSMSAHPASADDDVYSEDPRHGSMRGHAISAAEALRCLGRHLDETGRRATAQPRAGS
jgi:lysophospholipase L1-like esterase